MHVRRIARLTALGLLLAGLVGCGVPTPVATPGAAPTVSGMSTTADYFPLKASTRWTYHVEDKLNQVSGDRTVMVRDYSARNGESAQLVYYANGQELARQQVVKTTDALTWDAYGLTMDLAKLDKPGRIAEKPGRIINHLGFETVDTAAGRFEKCLKIEIQVNERMGRTGQEYRKVDTLWFAPGVGPVKRVYEEGYSDPKVGGWGKELIVSVLTQFQR